MADCAPSVIPAAIARDIPPEVAALGSVKGRVKLSYETKFTKDDEIPIPDEIVPVFLWTSVPEMQERRERSKLKEQVVHIAMPGPVAVKKTKVKAPKELFDIMYRCCLQVGLFAWCPHFYVQLEINGKQQDTLHKVKYVAKKKHVTGMPADAEGALLLAWQMHGTGKVVAVLSKAD